MTKTAPICTALLSLGLATASADEIVVVQKNKSFQIDGKRADAVVIHQGDSIRFKNEDPFFHNVFSLSDLNTFDLGSFSQGQSKTVTFNKPGIIEVECAIHPEMFMEVTIR